MCATDRIRTGIHQINRGFTLPYAFCVLLLLELKHLSRPWKYYGGYSMYSDLKPNLVDLGLYQLSYCCCQYVGQRLNAALKVILATHVHNVRS